MATTEGSGNASAASTHADGSTPSVCTACRGCAPFRWPSVLLLAAIRRCIIVCRFGALCLFFGVQGELIALLEKYGAVAIVEDIDARDLAEGGDDKGHHHVAVGGGLCVEDGAVHGRGDGICQEVDDLVHRRKLREVLLLHELQDQGAVHGSHPGNGGPRERGQRPEREAHRLRDVALHGHHRQREHLVVHEGVEKSPAVPQPLADKLHERREDCHEHHHGHNEQHRDDLRETVVGHGHRRGDRPEAIGHGAEACLHQHAPDEAAPRAEVAVRAQLVRHELGDAGAGSTSLLLRLRLREDAQQEHHHREVRQVDDGPGEPEVSDLHQLHVHRATMECEAEDSHQPVPAGVDADAIALPCDVGDDDLPDQVEAAHALQGLSHDEEHRRPGPPDELR
mmetsp:Transcript_28048/g.89135  ORF Transcript_28048/g.89135 Transcript_28048/m.89135 type:complete len:395 (-) Transcript_28048:421-1605(-)